jgi:hypothetical protein
MPFPNANAFESSGHPGRPTSTRRIRHVYLGLVENVIPQSGVTRHQIGPMTGGSIGRS